jgi:hypothetical protein
LTFPHCFVIGTAATIFCNDSRLTVLHQNASFYIFI